ncbi:MAG: GAF domain-containing protein, partial [Acidobacteria bacterium]|nr:GAF domain-containing protein [Acidobacteriota bacterium]
AMSTAGSLSEILTALLNAASAEAPRAALFVVNGNLLQGWRFSGFTGPSPASVKISLDQCPQFAEAVRTGEPAVANGDATAAPAFAALAFHAEALAFPIVLGGETVAMLYADSGDDAGRDVPATWRETLQILSRHASACLGHLTAVRTAQALTRGVGMASSEDDDGARRYARLLVSEIKLYNEPAVHIGRQNRDLLQRLRPEIERARRLYEERIPSAVHARGSVFRQELVQTLADGDPALLGDEAVAR